MATSLLGSTIDIHAGAVDLIFPHHENEIAQSEGATKKPFVRYWLHGEHLTVEGSKMSKSLGNVHTLRDLIARGGEPLAFRYLVLTAHYRSKLNFTWDSLASSGTALGRLRDTVLALRRAARRAAADAASARRVTRYERAFRGAIENDLDTPSALATLWELARDTLVSPREKLDTLLRFDTVLGLGLSSVRPVPVPRAVRALIAEREAARARRDFAASDTLRDRIAALGFSVDDTPDGPVIRRAA